MTRSLKGGLINVEQNKQEEPPEEEKKTSTRKTITIQKAEFELWEEIKGIHSWTSLLCIVREKAEQLDLLLSKQIVIGATPIYSGVPQRQSGILPTRNNTHSTNSIVVQKRPEYYKEYTKLLENGKFSGFLKPMTEGELDNLQMSEEDLEGAMIKSAEIAIARFKKENLSPPPS